MGETWLTLKGNPGFHKTGVSLKPMVKTLQQEGRGVWVEMGSLTAAGEKQEMQANQ